MTTRNGNSGARIGGMITDNSFRLDGSAEVLTLSRTLDDKRVIEFELGADQLDFSMDCGLSHTTFAVNYLEVNREPLWTPTSWSASASPSSRRRAASPKVATR
ncbi:MAG: hypothetical protein IPG63_17960 [Xanthomonadales bacterium]|nr:hypothetical protein [Xanthomonadales bacterium]